MAQVTGKRWPIVGKRLVSEFPYIEGEVTHQQLFTTPDPMDSILQLQTQSNSNSASGTERIPENIEVFQFSH